MTYPNRFRENLILDSLKRGEHQMPQKQMRAILPLGKGRVVARSDHDFKIAIGGSTTITVTTDTSMYDLRDGDLLSIYTEVLLAPKATQ